MNRAKQAKPKFIELAERNPDIEIIRGHDEYILMNGRFELTLQMSRDIVTSLTLRWIGKGKVTMLAHDPSPSTVTVSAVMAIAGGEPKE